MNPTLMDVGAWLLTYAVHSTVLLGAAALLTWRLVRRDAWRDTLWKAALFGGLVTATVQTALDLRPRAGSWDLGPAPSAAATPVLAPAVVTRDAVVEGVREAAAQPPAARAPQPLAPASAEDAVTPPPSMLAGLPDTGTLLGLWTVVAAALLGRLAWRQGRLRRMLRQRREVADGEVLGTLAELRRNAGVWMPVRLSASEVAPTPLALGRAEICVPPRFLGEMDRDHQRAALAHELAHLVRRDPLWHFAASAVGALFFFQPLNLLARRRLRESAEFLCDEWAARQTGSPLGLARCLAQVASWVAPGRDPIPAGTMAMAEGGSPLLRRVERLTAWRPAAELSPVLRTAAALAVLLPVAAMAPGVTAGREAPVRNEVALPPERVQEQVIEHKNPDETLAQRWEWALADARRRGGTAWIVYTFP
ncbi:MAG TPA: M56 family metallopeptidase, partial [Longimicrobium sp.]|nr:M56 family metallopeptidase [Longimicrobium sp.]